jgi:hypothetical protein
VYSNDFYNPYLDFNGRLELRLQIAGGQRPWLTLDITDFALRLPGYGLIPGITIPIISFWDGQPLR